MFDLDDIINQILGNCSICDARHAGLFSICGLALRLRDLYKWENGLDPWVERESSEVLTWIGEKEEDWDTISEKDFSDISILGQRFNPFDARGINRVLEPRGLFYGGGYARSLRPIFFLAELEEKKEMEGNRVFILGRELARDLVTVPALTQGKDILIRKESVKLFLWNQIFFMKKSARKALNVALRNYGVTTEDLDALHPHLARIADDQTDTYIYHELGELQDTVFDRELWREIIAAFPHTPIELLARSVKDLLADTNEHGTLQYIIKERKTASLAFFVAFFDGLRKTLFPQITEAFDRFTLGDDWSIIEGAVAEGYDIAKSYAEEISRIYLTGKQEDDMKWAETEMEKRLLEPIGITKPEA